MTTVADPAPPGPIEGIPLGRLVRVELSKTVDTRSRRWLLATVGVISTAVIAVKLARADPEDLTFGDFLAVTSTPLSLLLPLLAILAVTTEWTQRTALTTFTLEPRRERVVLAKLAALLALGMLAVTAALTTAALGNVAGAVFLDGAGAWGLATADVRDLALTQLLAVAQGFAFGLLLTNTAAAIVLYYLITPLWSTVLRLVDGLDGSAPWLDLSAALVPLSSDGSVSGQEWAQFASAATLWVLLPLGLGLVRLLRREIKPG